MADGVQRRVRVAAAGVDSLYLGWVFDLSERWRRDLSRLKHAAAHAKSVPTDPLTGEPYERVADLELVELGGQRWRVQGYGAGMAPYFLKNEDAELAINPDPGNGATASMKILAWALWRDPTMDVVRRMDDAVRDLARGGTFDERYPSRLDICADIQGWHPTASDFDLFCCPGRPTRTTYEGDVQRDKGGAPVYGPIELEHSLAPRAMWARGRLTGMRIGRPGVSPVVTRIYDKREEILSSHKDWMSLVWARKEATRRARLAQLGTPVDEVPSGYDEDAPVWRVEASVVRDGFLRGLRDHQGVPLETVEEVIGASGDIWRTVLAERHRLTLGDDERLHRARTRPEWHELTYCEEMDTAAEGGGVTRNEQDAVTLDALIASITGYHAKAAALAGFTGPTAHDDVTILLYEKVAALCESRSKPFPKLAREKLGNRIASQLKTATLDAAADVVREERRRAFTALRTSFEQNGRRPIVAPCVVIRARRRSRQLDMFTRKNLRRIRARRQLSLAFCA